MDNINEFSIEQAWQNWIMCLQGEDKNSVFNQITQMLWDTAIFHVIMKSQKEKYNQNPNAPKLNKQLYSFIFRNYFHTQSAYIRRLTDPNSSLTGKSGTYSLGAIVNHLIKYRAKLTRKKYLELRGLPYDYLKIRDKETEFLQHQPLEKGILVPQELNWLIIKEAHEVFDRLSHKKVDSRNADDVIDENVLVRLQNKLKDCRKIILYVNKFIAHAATPESRSWQQIDENKPSWNDIWKAHKIIYQVANFLSGVLFSTDHLPLAINHPSFFDHWDEPFFDKEEAINSVRTVLDVYREETNSWMVLSAEEVWSWIEK